VAYSFQNDRFALEYVESKVYDHVLWESHCHPQFEMISVLEGDVNVTAEGQSYRLKTAQAAIIPPLCYHSVTANEKGVYRRVTALFGGSMIPEQLAAHFSENTDAITIFPAERSDRLKAICQSSDPLFYYPLAESLMVQILYDTLNAPKHVTEMGSDPFLQSISLYVDEHIHEKILLDDLAVLTSRSRSSLCHLFEEKMNVSPKQYILQKKLALASKLIAEGTPPTVAAMQVGYDNYSNFYRMYLKHFGKNPKEQKTEQTQKSV